MGKCGEWERMGDNEEAVGEYRISRFKPVVRKYVSYSNCIFICTIIPGACGPRAGDSVGRA